MQPSQINITIFLNKSFHVKSEKDQAEQAPIKNRQVITSNLPSYSKTERSGQNPNFYFHLGKEEI